MPSRQTRIKAGLALAFILMSACLGMSWIFSDSYFNGTCGVIAIRKVNEQIDETRDIWLAVLEVANSSNRFALSRPIASLKTIRELMAVQQVPECLASYKKYVL